MKNRRQGFLVLIVSLLIFSDVPGLLGQEEEEKGTAPETTPQSVSADQAQAQVQTQDQTQTQSKVQTKPVKPAIPNEIDREKRITIHFPDTDIRLALETIAAKVGVGIIAGPEVKGKISIKLQDVPWEKGLDILLKTYGYTYVWEEGVIRVLTRKELQEMEMQTQIFKLQYADPSVVEKSVLVIMTGAGRCQANRDTKTLLVKENPENLKNVSALIEKLDRMAKQAMEEKEGGGPEEAPLPAAAKAEKEAKKALVLDFKEVPIRDAIAQISAISGVYISVGEEVHAVVTLSTGGKEVPWQKALKEIISASDLAYEPADASIEGLKAGDFLRLRSKDKMLEIFEKNEKIAERVEVEHVVVELKYVDAVDIKKILETQLTSRGKITVLEITGQAGWVFGTGGAGSGGSALAAPARAGAAKPAKSRTILLSDTPSSVRKMLQIIKAIDVMPYQIIIESKIVEVGKNFIRDFGFDIASGSSGLSSTSITQQNLHQRGDPPLNTLTMTGGGRMVNNGTIGPTNFSPITSGVNNTSGGGLISVKRVINTQFDAFIRAVEEDIGSNVISAPKIMTLNNQEAAIIVGTKFPIVTTTTTTGTTATTTVDLKYYQDIGVRMNVIPQVSDSQFINMIMHPSITAQNGSVTVFNDGGFQIASYPILTTREAETQILMKDGETIVIGGLLQDQRSDSKVGIPILQSLPFIGPAFSRNTTNTKKVDLLIFITAYILKKEVSQIAEVFLQNYKRSSSESAVALASEVSETSGTTP